MAYRRRQRLQQQQPTQGISLSSPSSSTAAAVADDLVGVEVDAAKAIRASSAHKDSSLSSAYGYGNLHSPSASASPLPTTPKDPQSHEYSSLKSLGESSSSMKSSNESKQGFWGSLARKAKAFLDDEDVQHQFESDGPTPAKLPQNQRPMREKHHNVHHSNDSNAKTQNPTLQKGLGAIASSLNYIGKSVEEGLTIVENRTAGIIQETRKHIRKKPSGSAAPNQAAKQPQMQHQSRTPTQADQEIQLKASRDVAMAMAAKAKLLLRELKTVKADLAFAKERCAQLEEENRILRENRERGDSPEDDDLIRLQLETLLAEKARLSHENSVYTRENRFLREVVEYHQLTMQDVVYLDESTEEVTEVYPIKVPPVPNMNSMPSNNSSSGAALDTSLQISQNMAVRPVPPLEFAPLEFAEGSQSSVWPSS